MDPCDFHATQPYILAEILLSSLSMAHEAGLFSNIGRGSSLRFKYAKMGRCAGDCSVISYTTLVSAIEPGEECFARVRTQFGTQFERATIAETYLDL